MADLLQDTALTLIEEAFDGLDEKLRGSLREAFGTLHLQIASIGNELALTEAEQDADKLLELLVQLAAVAAHAAARHVLPVMEKEAS